MAGKLIEPKVITDFNNKPVALLPVGFYFDDNRWERIWEAYDTKGESLTMEDLRELFPDDESLYPQNKVVQTGVVHARELNKLDESDS